MTDGQRRGASIGVIERQILATDGADGSLTADRLDALQAALAAHAEESRAARAGAPALRTLAERSAASVAAHLAAGLCPLMLTRFAALLPISGDEHGKRMAGEASAIEYAEAIAGMFAWERAVGPDSRLRAAI